MKRVQNTKARDLQKPIPGCMGRMINIFDLSNGTVRSKLLTEKAHQDGSSISGNQHSVVKPMDAVRIQTEDRSVRTVDHEARSSCEKSSGIPMKILLAQEMSQSTETDLVSPNAVARLMGLDVLPFQRPILNARGSSKEPYPCNTLPRDIRGNRQNQDWCLDNPTSEKIQSCTLEKFKDVFELKEEEGRHDESLSDKRVALVRQKFFEAKRLATDESLIRSRQFKEALEVLSLNRDLFLKFLEEPNPSSSRSHSTPRLTQVRRITLLKPTKTVEPEGGIHVKKHFFQIPGAEINKNHQSTSQSMRIVVLKPNPGKPHEIKSMEAYPFPSPNLFHKKCSFGGATTKISTKSSSEEAKQVARMMRKCLSGNPSNETMFSRVSMNGYIGEDNYDFSESDSEASKHSLDFINGLDSPRSIPSSSLASCSPESSVTKEARKRLSERWALVESNGNSRERGSSTLGEMLAIRRSKKEEASYLSSSLHLDGKKKDGDNSEEKNNFKNLSRSKSVPVSSSVHEKMQSKCIVVEESTKSTSASSSFKEKISSLFFWSKNPLFISDVGAEDESSMASSSLTSSGDESRLYTKAAVPVEKPRTSENFQDLLDKNSAKTRGSCVIANPKALSRSSPIGSLVRSLPSSDTKPIDCSRCLCKAYTERELFVSIEKMLSSFGRLDDDDADFSTTSTPLDPVSLPEFFFDKCQDGDRCRCRVRCSDEKLVFDCVNAAILDLGRGSLMGAYPWPRPYGLRGEASRGGGPAMMGWSSCKRGRGSNVGEVVERMICADEEERGRRWIEEIWRWKVHEFGDEIVGRVLDELVEEALRDFS